MSLIDIFTKSLWFINAFSYFLFTYWLFGIYRSSAMFEEQIRMQIYNNNTDDTSFMKDMLNGAPYIQAIIGVTCATSLLVAFTTVKDKPSDVTNLTLFVISVAVYALYGAAKITFTAENAETENVDDKK